MLGTLEMDNEQVLSLSVSSSGDSPTHGTSWPKPLTWGPLSPSHLTLLSVSNDDEKSLCGGAALHSREEPAKTEGETPGFAPCSEQADLLTITVRCRAPSNQRPAPLPHTSPAQEDGLCFVLKLPRSIKNASQFPSPQRQLVRPTGTEELHRKF